MSSHKNTIQYCPLSPEAVIFIGCFVCTTVCTVIVNESSNENVLSAVAGVIAGLLAGLPEAEQVSLGLAAAYDSLHHVSAVPPVFKTCPQQVHCTVLQSGV